MKWTLSPDTLLLIEGQNSFLLAGRAERPFTLHIETTREELSQAVTPDDLVVVSSPEGGPLEPAIMLLDLVRKYHTPLVVLPREHPGSKRLKLVVAVSGEILTSCTIKRGTHPEQHLLCSSEGLDGIHIKGREGGVVIEELPRGITVRILPSGVIR